MAFEDALKDKILKLASKQKLGAVIKYSGNPSEDIRMTVAIALGMIPTYDSGMALIPLLRDTSPMVRASACESAAAIHAKVCEEYVKKLAFTETDLNVKQVAKRAFAQRQGCIKPNDTLLHITSYDRAPFLSQNHPRGLCYGL